MRSISAVLLSVALVLLAAAPAFGSVVVQDFEGSTFPPDGWTLAGSYNLWSRTTTCSGYGTGAAAAKADFYNNAAGRTQDLITLSIYPAVATDSLKFDHAYATYATEVDSLKIYTSTNGGTSWTLLIGLAGGKTGPLNTYGGTGATTAEFVPTAAQWATKKYTLPAGTNKIKFTARSAFGNQLYLDNVKVSYPNLAHDAAVTSINTPVGALPGRVAVAPQVVVKNTGTNSESFSATCKIKVSGGAEIYSQALSVTSLAAGSSQTLTYPSWTPDSGECYNVTAYTSLTGDLFAGNDTSKSLVTTYFSTNRVMIEYFTATSCPPCVAGNDSMNHVFADLKNYMSVIRTHVWWPTNNDPYYLGRGLDTSENRARVSFYGVSGVPTCVAGGISTPDLYSYRSTINSQRMVSKPITLSLYGHYSLAGDSGVVVARITGTGRLPAASKAALVLRYAIVEDSSFYTGTNGDPEHFQILRDMVPNNTGITINIDKGVIVTDSQKFKITTTGSNPYLWNENQCYVVAYVQNNATKEIYQSGNAKITALTPLAVELSAFTAEAGGGAVTLRWKTESETDNYQWLIDRSTSADQGFERLAALPAASSPNGRSYSYTDATASPGQDYYYRLGDQDLGGTITWSNAVFVSGAGTVVGKAWLGPVHPNPCRGQTVIQYALPRPGRVSLRIYDICGRLVRVLRGGAEGAGIKQQPWDLTDERGRAVANGVYFYTLDAGYFTATRKLMVVR